ncbi:DUF58 domain-containing protein [Nocardiopsis sediminis]|uniref:DUF58 domain-containing protein n=1 Tax=Nocardiopsis sediminis TaxID=1778267 RepID=A0ABV8FI98_9ACTN
MAKASRQGPGPQTWALVDAAAAMDVGDAAMPKRDLATSVVTAVALLAERSPDPIGVRIAYGGMLDTVPANDGPKPLLRTLRTLYGLADPIPWAAPALDLAGALDRLHLEHPGPGLRIIASPFPVAGDRTGPLPWEASLRRLAVRHDVIAVEIADPRELALPDVGVVALVDPATGHRREIATSDPRLRERHAAAAQAIGERRRAAFHAAGVAHVRLGTGHPWLRAAAAAAATPGRGTERPVPATGKAGRP